MTPEIAQGTLALLNRVDLKGSEVEGFNIIKNSLIEICTPPKVEEKPTEKKK